MKSIPAELTKEEIRELELTAFEGPIEVVNQDDQLASALAPFAEASVLGFDTETRPNFRKGQANPVSLLQLCDGERAVLIQLKNITDFTEISKLLSDDNIIKTGVAIHDDIKALQKLFSFSPQAFIDSGKQALQLGFKRSGLRNLAATLLGIRISKSAQLSNWAKVDLDANQERYAATDAWVSHHIYIELAKY